MTSEPVCKPFSELEIKPIPAKYRRMMEAAYRRGYCYGYQKGLDHRDAGASSNQMNDYLNNEIDKWRFATPLLPPVDPPFLFKKKKL